MSLNFFLYYYINDCPYSGSVHTQGFNGEELKNKNNGDQKREQIYRWSHQGARGPKIHAQVYTIQGDKQKVKGGKGCPRVQRSCQRCWEGGTIFVISAPQGVFQPPEQTGTGYVTVRERGWDPVELPAHIGTQTCLKVTEIPYHGAVSTWTHRKGRGHIPSRWAYKSSSRRKRSLSWALRDERT